MQLLVDSFSILIQRLNQIGKAFGRLGRGLLRSQQIAYRSQQIALQTDRDHMIFSEKQQIADRRRSRDLQIARSRDRAISDRRSQIADRGSQQIARSRDTKLAYDEIHLSIKIVYSDLPAAVSTSLNS